MRRFRIRANAGHGDTSPILLNGLILLIILAVLGGCGRGDHEDQSSAPEGLPDTDRLRALPYVGGTSAGPDHSPSVLLHDEERVCPGYRLYTVPMLARAELIDEQGRVLRQWQGQAHDRWQRAVLLPDGDLLVIGAEGQGWISGRKEAEHIPDSTRYILRLDSDGRQVWKRRLTAHHDIDLWPDGKLLVLTLHNRERTGHQGTVLIRDDHLTLLDGQGRVLESKSLLDAIQRAPDRFPFIEVAIKKVNGVPWVDLFHANSVERMHDESLRAKDPLYGPENILVCFRHQDRIAIFDWPRNRVVWAWGQGRISGPHDAQILQNGHILLFDNGLSRGWSRVLEIDPLTDEIMWEYRGQPPESFFTVGRGSAQRLPNGNTLMAESDRGRALEVTAEGNVVWEFLCPHRLEQHRRAAIVRMIWYSDEYLRPLLDARDSTMAAGHDSRTETINDPELFCRQMMLRCAHYCEVKKLPPGFELLASSGHCRIAAVRHRDRPLYGTQFHPEA